MVGVSQVKAKGVQGNPSTESGKSVEVWKKQPDGKWKCVADIFDSDMPLPSPTTEKEMTILYFRLFQSQNDLKNRVFRLQTRPVARH